MTTILVTGGAGYIGSHTCKALAAKGYTPVVFDNLSTGHREFVKWGELIEGDIRDTAKLRSALEDTSAKAVIHFAALAYVGESIQQPQRYYENNVVGSLSLLRAMRDAGCQSLVFSSTCAVYGEVTELPINIAHPTHPINPYGRSKRLVEQVLEDCHSAYQLDSVALRYFNAAGADLDGEIGERRDPEPHLIPNVIRAALNADAILELYGDDYPTSDGSCVRDYIHVADLASAHVKALEYLVMDGGRHGAHRFNLGAGTGTSNKEMIALVEHYAKAKIETRVMPRRPGDPSALYADITHTRKVLGWEPKVSDIDTIIRSALAWEQKELDRE